MKPEDKQLLLKDLCARLPYGVIVYLKYDENTSITREMGLGSLHDIMFDSAAGKPYLRPMSSMSEEEDKEFGLLQTDFYTDGFLYPIAALNLIDWLNAHYFDYRGLIEKGLALKAPEGMYKSNKRINNDYNRKILGRA
jgi:hypothetical protein